MNKHQRYDAARMQDPGLAAAHRLRGSSQWQTLRRLMLKLHPLCVDPFNDGRCRLAYSKDVHHVIPLQSDLRLGLVQDNLRCLCTSCHADVSQLERTNGTAAVRLFLTEQEEASLRQRHTTGNTV